MINFRKYLIEEPDDQLVILLGLQMVFCFYTVAFSSISGGLLIFVFLLGAARKRLVEISKEKWFYFVVAILIWAPITLLWSSNKLSGYDELKNLWFYFLLIIGSTVYWNDKRIKIILSMFIFGAMSNFVISMAQWANFWPLGGYDPVQGPVGYSYRVFLGVDTVPLIIFMIWDAKNKYLFKKMTYPILFSAALLFQLGITTGRTGQALLAILIVPFSLLIFKERRRLLFQIYSLLCVILVLMVVFIPSIDMRWNDALHDVLSFFSGKPDTDVGLRMVFWDSAFHIIYAHPFFGIGPGSFVGYTEHLMLSGKIPLIERKDWGYIEPHNSFLAYATSYGLIGFILIIGLLSFLMNRAWAKRKYAVGFFQLVMISSFVVGSFSDVMIFRFAVVAPFMVAVSMVLKNKYNNENE